MRESSTTMRGEAVAVLKVRAKTKTLLVVLRRFCESRLRDRTQGPSFLAGTERCLAQSKHHPHSVMINVNVLYLFISFLVIVDHRKALLRYRFCIHTHTHTQNCV